MVFHKRHHCKFYILYLTFLRLMVICSTPVCRRMSGAAEVYFYHFYILVCFRN